MQRNILQNFIIYTGIILIASSCIIGGKSGKWSGSYKLQGASIPAGTSTATVQYFQNQALQVQPTLAMQLTEGLKDKLLSDTKLTLVNSGGDIIFEGAIKTFEVQPMAPQGGDNPTAGVNRLTVTIEVKFSNSKEHQYDFDFSPFTRYKDFDANKTLAEVEQGLLEDIVKELVEDIYNKAFVNW
jgi:hypothetical protein